MVKYFLEKDNKKLCFFGVKDHYIWFSPTEHTNENKNFLAFKSKRIYNDLLNKYKYFYTFSRDDTVLNKWHLFLGMKINETFIYKNKKYNIWVNK